MGRLLTDEELRVRFLARPLVTLAELRDEGYDLSPWEIEALGQGDQRMWESMARRIHPRLQRCSLRPPARRSFERAEAHEPRYAGNLPDDDLSEAGAADCGPEADPGQRPTGAALRGKP